MQFTGLKHLDTDIPAAVKLEDGDEVTEEVVLAALRRALDQMSSLQAEDGHWPGHYSAIMYLMPFWVRSSCAACIFLLTGLCYLTFLFASRAGFRAARHGVNRCCPYRPSINERFAVIITTTRQGNGTLLKITACIIEFRKLKKHNTSISQII